MSTPVLFSASIGACFAEYFSLELANGTLTYRVSKLGGAIRPTEKFTPTAEQWQDFRRALDDMRVWDWNSEYRNGALTDGAEWSLEIDYGDCKVKSEGVDSFPGSFPAFRAAVTRLLEGKTF